MEAQTHLPFVAKSFPPIQYIDESKPRKYTNKDMWEYGTRQPTTLTKKVTLKEGHWWVVIQMMKSRAANFIDSDLIRDTFGSTPN